MQVIVGNPAMDCTSYLITPFLDGYSVRITYRGEGVAAFDHTNGKLIGMIDQTHEVLSGAAVIALLNERGSESLVREIPAYYRRQMLTTKVSA
jgi:hypothetical protein